MSSVQERGTPDDPATQQALADLSALVEEGLLLLWRRRARQAVDQPVTDCAERAGHVEIVT